MIPNVSRAQMFTLTTTNDILLTVSFPGFNWEHISSNKIDKTSICIAKLISTGCSSWFLCTKILPKLKLLLSMIK